MAADGRKVWLGIAGVLMAGACSAPPLAKGPDGATAASSERERAPSRPAAANAVEPASDSAPIASEQPRTSIANVFHCHARTPSAARIEAAFKTDWLVYDGHGADAGGSTLLDAQVSLEITPTDTGAAVTLRALRDAPSEQYEKLRYREALDHDWLELGKPFTLERRANDWCFAAKQPCPAKRAWESDFARALGQSIELLAPISELSTALDGKPSDGTRELRLPQLLVLRLGLVRSQPISAVQVGLGFPARFEAELHAERTELIATETSGGKAPRSHSKDVTLRAEVDEHCRLVHYAVKQDAKTTIAPGTQSASRFVHTRSYSVVY